MVRVLDVPDHAALLFFILFISDLGVFGGNESFQKKLRWKWDRLLDHVFLIHPVSEIKKRRLALDIVSDHRIVGKPSVDNPGSQRLIFIFLGLKTRRSEERR